MTSQRNDLPTGRFMPSGYELVLLLLAASLVLFLHSGGGSRWIND